MAAVVPGAGGGYWLVENILNINLVLPAEITPLVRLERATDEQIELLREIGPRDRFHGTSLASGRECKYEIVERMANGWRAEKFDLPRNEWRYLICSYSGTGAAMADLFRLCEIVEPPFGF